MSFEAENLNNSYKIIKKLKKESFGETYLAEADEKAKKTVIIKQLKIDSFSLNYIKECKGLFQEEAEKFKKIEKEQVSDVPSLEAYIVGDKNFYLVVEYLERQNFNEENIVCHSCPNFLLEEQLNVVSFDIIKFIKNIPQLHPRKFCRRWFDLESLREDGRPRYREEQILEIEVEWGYREQCINLLSKILKLKPNTIQRWGKGVEFNKIPFNKRKQYEIYLGYVDAIRTLFMKKYKSSSLTLSNSEID